MAVFSVLHCKIYYHCDLYYDSLQIWINMLLYKYTVNLFSSVRWLSIHFSWLKLSQWVKYMDTLKLQAFPTNTCTEGCVSVKYLSAAQCVVKVGRNKAFRGFHTKEKECDKITTGCKRRDFICWRVWRQGTVIQIIQDYPDSGIFSL